MTIKELRDHLDYYIQMNPRYEDLHAVIPYQSYHRIGGNPRVEIESVHKGFDWDAGNVFLYPEKELIPMPKDHLQKEAEKSKWIVKAVEQRLSTMRKQFAASISLKIASGASALEIRDWLKEQVSKLENK